MSQHLGPVCDIAPHFAYPPPTVPATTFIRKMRGRSQAILVEDPFKNLYILKMGHHSLDFHGLANELIGVHLCRSLGMSVPENCFIEVDEQFLDRYPHAQFQSSNGHVRPPSGLHYGTAFVGAAKGTGQPFDVLPRTSKYVLSNREQVCGMYLFDVWANHLDYRQSVYLRNLEEDTFRPVFIDNGSLFGGSLWDFEDPKLQTAFRRRDAGNVEWRDDVVHAWLKQFRVVIPTALTQILEAVPFNWCPGKLKRLEVVLLERLEGIEELVRPFIPAHQH